MDRVIGIAATILLVVRLLPLLRPFISPQQHRALRNMVSGLDVAGGIIMLGLVGYQLYRRQWLGALLIAVLAVPVLIGTWRALPAWWWGAADSPRRNPPRR